MDALERLEPVRPTPSKNVLPRHASDKRVNIADTEAQILLAGVSVRQACCLVYVEVPACVWIDHFDNVCGLVNLSPEQLKSLFHPFALGDVTGDADQPDHGARFVAIRSFGGKVCPSDARRGKGLFLGL